MYEYVQILVKVHAAGLNPVDAQIREQSFTYKFILPLILGKEVAGDVVQVCEHIQDSQNKYKVL